MIEENEQLPETWIKAKVGDLADIVSPGFPYGQYNIEGKGLPHLRPMNIDGQGRLCLDEIKYVDVVDPPLLQRNDILFNNTNSPVWVGKTTTIPESNKFTFSNHMTLLRIKKDIGEAKFFSLQLQYLQQQGYFLTRCTNHVNQASISSTYLARNVELVIAPLAEQQRIVEAIEQQFSRLDAGIASLRSAQKKLKLYRASVLKAAVEGELTAEWRAANPPTESASVLLERIRKERHERWEEEQRAKGKDPTKQRYIEPVAPDVDELPNLPEGWSWATVDQVISRSEYGTSTKCSYEGGGAPVLRIPNIASGEIDLTDIKYSIQKLQLNENDALQVGDVLVCRTNGSVSLIGKTALVRKPFNALYTFASYLLRFRFSGDLILSKWFHMYITSPQGRGFIESNAASSAGQHNISLSLIHGMIFPIPPVAEQQRVISLVEERMSILNALETTIEKALKRAELQRQSILHQAFTGKLVPQDPNDEPASVLLERIQQERDQNSKQVKTNGHGAGRKRTARKEEPVLVQETQAEPIDARSLVQQGLW